MCRALAATLGAALVTAGLAGCGHPDRPEAPLTWSAAASLPVGAGDRALVRGATWCSGRWVVVGATADARGRTRPAVWVSADGTRWGTVPLDPGDDYYAARAILGSVGCAHGRLAALGSKSGGAHGNPRTASWRELSDGSLAAVPARFELYGGPSAVAVSRLAGGHAGYLIAGTRARGAAVWTSRTGSPFRLHEGVPGLASTSHERTQALDAVWWGGSWTVVGDSVDRTGRLSATAWTGSGDGPWRPRRLPGGSTITTAERVVLTGSGPLAVGLDDQGFGAWAESGGRWSLESTFGRVDPGATSAAYVSGAAWTGSRLVTTYSDGARFHLASGTTGVMVESPLPTAVTVGGDRTATVTAHGPHLLLLTDDGDQGRIWLARLQR